MSDIDLEVAITRAEALSDITKRNYKDRVRALVQKANGKPILEIVMHPAIYGPLIKQWYTQSTSQKASFTAILALFRYNPEFKTKHMTLYDQWSTLFKATDQQVTDRYETNAPSQRQTNGYVPYEELLRVRDTLPEGDIQRLLLGVYTHIKPLRAEYARIALYVDALPDDLVEPNYIFIKKNKTAQLVIRKFKTLKHHEAFDIPMPEPLMKDMMLSLKSRPREWLFTNTNGEPYSQSLFSQWTGKVFKSLFGKPLTIQLIRHSFINTLDFNTLTIVEKKALATEMGHTVQTQDQYRLIFKDSKQECSCECKSKSAT